MYYFLCEFSFYVKCERIFTEKLYNRKFVKIISLRDLPRHSAIAEAFAKGNLYFL